MAVIRAQRCEVCKFYSAPLPTEERGECRYDPPKVSSFLVPGPDGGPQNLNVTSFPTVDSDAWCGKYTTGLLT